MNLAVLASGSGTILESILERGIAVRVVVVDRPCRAELIAKEHGVPVVRVLRSDFGKPLDRWSFTEAVCAALKEASIDLVVMAGFMTILEDPLFDSFAGRVLNTHPSLLPDFPGAHAVRDAMVAGVAVTGCTVHIAEREVDAGPVVASQKVEVLATDDEATLHERIKAQERILFPLVIRRVVEAADLAGQDRYNESLVTDLYVHADTVDMIADRIRAARMPSNTPASR